MSVQAIHHCQCFVCQKAAPNPIRQDHALMNTFFGKLNEEQRRFYVGLEARKRGPGSEHELALVFGWSQEAIAMAKCEVVRACLGEGRSLMEQPSAEEAVNHKLAKTKLTALNQKGRQPNLNQWKGPPYLGGMG